MFVTLTARNSGRVQLVNIDQVRTASIQPVQDDPMAYDGGALATHLVASLEFTGSNHFVHYLPVDADGSPAPQLTDVAKATRLLGEYLSAFRSSNRTTQENARADASMAGVNDVTSPIEPAIDGVGDATTVPMGKPGNLGFDGRVFLTDAEHQTYLRRKPVRFVQKVIAASNSCSVCGEDGSRENPLQVAHVVPFGLGVVHFKLTPEWLDGPANLRWAHRRVCNKAAELSVDQTRAHLIELGVLPADSA